MKKRKILLIASLAINIGILGYFKYANFFIENFNLVLTNLNFTQLQWTQIALPIGISFFTFQSITYTIDVYRDKHKPLVKLHDYLLYILMFPQLIAGPIVRFNTVADDIIDREKNDTINNKLNGIYLFVIGLSKKVLIANVLGEFVDNTFSTSISETSTQVLWLTIIAYSFQIYYDFSGYSDMAIGLGRIIGFNFPENFNNPYISQNITEFWRRWHITLGEWMKDYLYIPLGGNRVKSVQRLYLNLIIVFLISGFWHGAEWTFIIWGAWHGLFLVLDRLFFIKLLSGIGKFPRIAINYVIVLIGWVFFRSENLSESVVFLKGMFSFDSMSISGDLESKFVLVLVIAIILSFSGAFIYGEKIQNALYSNKTTTIAHLFYFVFAFLFLVICSAYITASGFNPFIYFRF
ncbi:MAG: MBOAT family O-acyltransferase [Salinivirgaceae bacterium]|nr:MBOAT family O-acyltransferase [Salinivirgaceae bacterium]